MKMGSGTLACWGVTGGGILHQRLYVEWSTFSELWIPLKEAGDLCLELEEVKG